jgi:hypothetical protein
MTKILVIKPPLFYNILNLILTYIFQSIKPAKVFNLRKKRLSSEIASEDLLCPLDWNSYPFSTESVSFEVLLSCEVSNDFLHFVIFFRRRTLKIQSIRLRVQTAGTKSVIFRNIEIQNKGSDSNWRTITKTLKTKIVP